MPRYPQRRTLARALRLDTNTLTSGGLAFLYFVSLV